MKIDAHQHFWKYDPAEYPWIDDSMNVLKNDYLPDDLFPELKKNGFDGCVAVQARPSRDENVFLSELARKRSFIKGVVGWVDLQSDHVEKELEALCRLPGVCGVRHIVQDEPDDDFLLKPDFLRGISFLKDYNLTYDILIYPKHLAVTHDFVKRFPDQRFVLDHMAKPDIRRGFPDDVWSSGINRLAAFPNVYCKLSGMVTETNWHAWKQSDFVPYMDVIFNAFGTDRVMIGSDWPVCRLSGEYSEVIGIVKHYLLSFSKDEMNLVTGENAVRFYGLE